MKKSKQSVRLFDAQPLRSETRKNFKNKTKEPSHLQKLTMSAASILALTGIGASVASNTFLSQEAEMSGISQANVNPYRNVDVLNLNNARYANDLLAKTTQNSIQHQDIELYQNVVKINSYLDGFTINNNKSNRLQMTYRVYNDILAHKNDSENILRLKLARSYQNELNDDILEQHIDKTITQEMYTLLAQQQHLTPENIKSQTTPVTGNELQNLETYLYGKYTKQTVKNNNVVYQPVTPTKQSKPVQQNKAITNVEQPKAQQPVQPQSPANTQSTVKSEPKKEAPVKTEPKKDTPVKTEPKKDTPVKTETKKEAPVKSESKKETPVKTEPKKDTPVKSETKKEAPVKTEPKKDTPVKSETKKEAPVKTEPKKDTPVKTEPKKEAPVKTEPKKEVPVKSELKKEAPVKSEPKKEVPVKSETKAEVKTEAPKAEVKQEAPKAEVKQEAPKVHNKYEITYDKNGRIIKTKEFMATFNEAVNKKPKDRTKEERDFLFRENYDRLSHDPTANGTVGHDLAEWDLGN